MKKINVTLLESFRRFQVGTSENYDTEQQLVEQLSGKFDGNDKTNIGGAIHFIIENYGSDRKDYSDKFQEFKVKIDTTKHIDLLYNHCQSIRPYTPEIPLSKTFKTQYGELLVSGKMDVLQGNVIRDTKVTFRTPEMQKYMESIQWKLYLSIFELDRFIYDIFEVIGYDETMGRDISNCEIKLHEPFECLRYEKMETDIENTIASFCDWVDYRCLWGKIQEAK